jgi:hypothetical protein
MKRRNVFVLVGSLAAASAMIAAAVAVAAIANDGRLGYETPTDFTASSSCPDGVFAVGVQGNRGMIGPNPVASTARMECQGDAGSPAMIGSDPGNSLDETKCSPGQVAVGIVGREGDFIDNLAVRCQDDSLTGSVEDAVGIGGSGGSADGPYDCPAGQGLTGLTGSTDDPGGGPSYYVREVEIVCAPPAPAKSTTTLSVKKTSDKVKASGSVKPKEPGVKVGVTLYKKKNGHFKELDSKHPKLDAQSRYATSFNRPSFGDCKIKAAFPGSDDAKPSKASKTFSC